MSFIYKNILSILPQEIRLAPKKETQPTVKTTKAKNEIALEENYSA